MHAQGSGPTTFHWEIQIDGQNAPDKFEVEILNDQGNPVCADPDVECRLLPASSNTVTTQSTFAVGSEVFNISTDTAEANNLGDVHLVIADPWDDTDFLTLRFIHGGPDNRDLRLLRAVRRHGIRYELLQGPGRRRQLWLARPWSST